MGEGIEIESIGNVFRFGYSQQLLAAAHPGLGTFHVGRHQKIYHMYYQWVFLFFCIQVAALMFDCELGNFYLYLWKCPKMSILFKLAVNT